jgi:hypothetical protein
MRRVPTGGRPGLSILETVLAISLLSAILIFVLSILPTGVFSLKKAEDLEAASAYGESWLDQARQSPPSGNGTDRTADVALNHTTFHVVRSVRQIPPDLVDVTVTMTWNPAEPPLHLGTRLYVGTPPSGSPSP